MIGEVEFGKCEICGKEASLQRAYFRYSIICECHNQNHFDIVRHCKDCTPVKPKETKVFLSTDRLELIGQS